jgi:recombination protein RecA
MIKNGTESTGARTRVKVVKNKIAPPFRQAEFDIIFGSGVSRAGDVLDLAVEHGIVMRSGTFYNYRDERLGQGRDNCRIALDENKELLARMEADVKAKIAPAKAAELAAVGVAEE